jgi:F-type H+-transporting ATPase subunit c
VARDKTAPLGVLGCAQAASLGAPCVLDWLASRTPQFRPQSRLNHKEEKLSTLIAATSGDVTKAGKAIALALGIGLGSLGAGIGIGNIFGSMIQAVARQPELRGELQGIQWLGFALTEAVVFYGLIGGLLAYVLIT